MSRVTAVIPCYNSEAYVAGAIESVLAQARPVDEVLVVDDASTDRTAEVARASGATVITLAGNTGPAGARNEGLRRASGDLVAFLDADDRWTPTHCTLVVGLLERSPQAVVGFGRATWYEAPNLPSPTSLPDGVPSDALNVLIRTNPVPQSAAVVRREAAIAAGGYDGAMRHSEDYDLWMRLAAAAPFVCTHAITCYRHLHTGQASRDLHAMRQGTWAVRRKLLASLDDRGDTIRRQQAWQASVEGWRHELQEAWLSENPAGLDAALAIRRTLPLPLLPYIEGVFRRRVLWAPRQVARTVYRLARGRQEIRGAY